MLILIYKLKKYKLYITIISIAAITHSTIQIGFKIIFIKTR